MSDWTAQDRRNVIWYVVSGILILVGAVCAVGVLFQGYIDAPPRSIVSRVRSDMRSLATALEAYYVDNDAYPSMQPLANFTADAAMLGRMRGTRLNTIAGLTTPIAYITTLFADPFAQERGLPFAYHTDGDGWILISPGPDGIYDITDPVKVYDSTTTQPSHLLIGGPWTWDPTNGVTSRGDIWRVKQ